jgi:hypothetical protein
MHFLWKIQFGTLINSNNAEASLFIFCKSSNDDNHDTYNNNISNEIVPYVVMLPDTNTDITDIDEVGSVINKTVINNKRCLRDRTKIQIPIRFK